MVKQVTETLNLMHVCTQEFFSLWWEIAASVSLTIFFFLFNLKVMQVGVGTCRYNPTHIVSVTLRGLSLILSLSMYTNLP